MIHQNDSTKDISICVYTKIEKPDHQKNKIEHEKKISQAELDYHNLVISIKGNDTNEIKAILTKNDQFKDAALTLAIKDNKALTVKWLIKWVDLSSQKYGETALHWSAEQGSVESAMVLMDNGFDPNEANYFGETPIRLAIESDFRRREMVQTLIEYGADPTLKDNDSVSADDIAIELYNKTVLEWLESY